MKPEKKKYHAPRLTIHGDLEKITLMGGAPNSDVAQGPNNTAFSPGP